MFICSEFVNQRDGACENNEMVSGATNLADQQMHMLPILEQPLMPIVLLRVRHTLLEELATATFVTLESKPNINTNTTPLLYDTEK